MAIRELTARANITSTSLQKGSIANPSRTDAAIANRESGVGIRNPVAWSDEREDTDHFYEDVNRFKVVELMRVNAADAWPQISSHKDWGHWRELFTPNVSRNVLLIPEDKVFNFAYTNNYGKAWDSLTSGAVGRILQAGEFLRSAAAMSGQEIQSGGKFVSRFKEAPTWISTLPLEMSSTLKFNFAFGQAGLFNAEHEVVWPIIQLARLFLPRLARDKDDPTYLVGPVPTPPSYAANFISSFFTGDNTLLSSGREMMDAGRNFTSTDAEGNENTTILGQAANAITALERALLRQKDSTIEYTLRQHGQNHGGGALAIRMGRMTFGPFLIKNVAWNFDFTHTDDYGFPYKGSLTFSGLESIVMPNVGQMGSFSQP